MQTRLGCYYAQFFSESKNAEQAGNALIANFAKALFLRKISEAEKEYIDQLIMRRHSDQVRFESFGYLPNEPGWHELLTLARSATRSDKAQAEQPGPNPVEGALKLERVEITIKTAFFQELYREGALQNMVEGWKLMFGEEVIERLLQKNLTG